MLKKSKSAVKPPVRDPDKTRRRILNAALKEFSARGFAGARVNEIARRAAINKRMLYHYFEDKEGLFRAVLRDKIQSRMHQVEAKVSDEDLVSSMPQWFRQNCQDGDWVRLLAWESLQTLKDKVLDEKARTALIRLGAAKIKEKQVAGVLRTDVSPLHLLLAKVSLSMFPMAMPQVARLILGHTPRDVKFQAEYTLFLQKIAQAFRAAAAPKGSQS